MTEDEWLNGNDPEALLDHLATQGEGRSKAGKRRLRLFGCACCRRIWHLLDKDSRAAIEACERFADGLLSKEEVARVETETLHRGWGARRETSESRALWACHNAIRQGAPPKRASGVVHLVGGVVAGADKNDIKRAARRGVSGPAQMKLAAEEKAQCALVHEVFGNPFRPLARRKLPAHVLSLAQECYAAFPRVSDRFPLLADALEDLGEERAAEHCRAQGHVKGCHVVDWALGRS
jgi:hypothetical protein